MCKDCRLPKKAHYEGNRLILERDYCPCQKCLTVVYTGTGPRCEVCGCLMRTELTDDNPKSWEANPFWLINGRPVRTDQVLHTPEPDGEVGEEIVE